MFLNPSVICPPLLRCSCFNWIDKKVNYSRWLTLDSIQEGGATYGGASKLAAAAAAGPGAAWQPAGHKSPPLIRAGSGGSFTQQGQRQLSPQHRNGGGPQYFGGVPQRPGSPLGSPLRGAGAAQRKMAAGGAGSPVRAPVIHWGSGGGSPSSLHTVRSGVNQPGSPMIGAARSQGR